MFSAQSDEKLDCENAYKNNDIEACAKKDALHVEAKLKALLQELDKKIEPIEQIKLKDAHAAWVSYRKAQCDFEVQSMEGGRSQPIYHWYCMQIKTRNYIEIIEKKIECIGKIGCIPM